MLQKEQDRLNDVQTKLVNESRKREQDLRKQVHCHLSVLDHILFSSLHSIKPNWREWKVNVREELIIVMR